MSLNSNRVVWTEGLFIKQQHFQQQERFLEGVARRLFQSCGTWLWGFSELSIDTSLLKLGKFGLLRAEGVLPDGTPFEAPQNDPLPAPLDLGADAVGQIICLSLPLQSAEYPEHDLKRQGAGASVMARFTARDVEVTDNTASGKPQSLMILGALGLRLGLADPATQGNLTSIGVARVLDCHADGSIDLDPDYVPPLLSYGVSNVLHGFAKEIVGLSAKRAAVLSERVAKPDQSSVAELAEYLTLLGLNRHQPTLRHVAGMPRLHPRELYVAFLQLVGELAIFCMEGRVPRVYSDYDHDRIFESFAPVVEDLRRALSMVIEQSAIALDLEERRHGVRVSIVRDPDLYTSANFVLAVNAQIPPESLRLRLPTQLKVGPIDKIRDLVNLHLPGVGLNWMPVAPRQIPYHAGFHYFELDRRNELWGQLARSGGIAFHLAGEFPGIQLEFWAIREEGAIR